jgi:hypothetical protein
MEKEFELEKIPRFIVQVKLKQEKTLWDIIPLPSQNTHEPKLKDYHAYICTCSLGVFHPVDKKEWICLKVLFDDDLLALNLMLATFYNKLDKGKKGPFELDQIETLKTIMILVRTRHAIYQKKWMGFEVIDRYIIDAEKQADYHMTEIKRIACKTKRLKDLGDELGYTKTEKETAEVLLRIENEAANDVQIGVLSNADQSTLSEIMLTCGTKSSEKRRPGRPRIYPNMYCNPDPAKRGYKKRDQSKRKASLRAKEKMNDKELYEGLTSGISRVCGSMSDK